MSDDRAEGTMSENDTVAEATTERTERTETFRVLKRDEGVPRYKDEPHASALWYEYPALAVTHRYPYMSAERLGEAYGEGDYIVIQQDGYNRAQTFSVVADKVYREADASEGTMSGGKK